MLRLQDKICLVTGAASGIGLATATRFVQEGARVLLTDVAEDAGRATAENLGNNAAFIRHDVRAAQDWQAALDAVIGRWGRLDVLVNNAGIGTPGDVESVRAEDWQRVLDINLNGVFHGTQHAIARMKTSGGGAIVNVASIEGVIGDAALAAYNASKGGVRIFSRSAAIHCARSGYNIRINCVCPSFIETPLVAENLASLSPEEAQQFQQMLMMKIPMQRLGKAEEIANAILFCASDEASFMTGADLVIDGGHTA